MAADAIIYCLEQLTDYRQFERFGNDLMRLEGYADLEPLGGTADKGRDAININRTDKGDITIFAYSVREDWRAKLRKDVKSIIENGHQFGKIVFLCTADVNATERDEAVKEIHEKHGAELQIFALERIRNLLATTHKSLIAQHPSIFTPDFFRRAGGLILCDTKDYVLIDFADADYALANWLGARLILAGFHVWWKTRAPVAGTSLNECIESLMTNRCHQFISILSESALADPELVARRILATTTRGGILIPAKSNSFDISCLDARTRNLQFAPFDVSWAQGLQSVVETLECAGTPRFSEARTATSSHSFRVTDVLKSEPEQLLSNRFSVVQLPKVVYRFDSKTPIEGDRYKEICRAWSCRSISPTRFLSFHEPPDDVKQMYGLVQKGGVLTDVNEVIEKLSMRQVLPDLIRKSIYSHCLSLGLAFCPETKLYYVPEKLLESERLYFVKPDGERSWCAPTGERKYWRPGVSSMYKYHLAPTFFVVTKPDSRFAVVCRIRIRLTDSDGVVLKPRTRNSRRKHLCGEWWNNHWLHRTLAVMQHLSSEGRIKVGPDGEQQIVINAEPDSWLAGPSIDESALKDSEALRELLTAYDTEEFENDQLD